MLPLDTGSALHSADPDLYVPRSATIVRVTTLTPKEKLFRLVMNDLKPLGPGEFVAVTFPGIGEAPISLCSSPHETRYFEIAVRRIETGIAAHTASDTAVMTLMNVTTALHQLGVGGEVGIRGPYGTQFPVERFHGWNVAVIVGGIGFFPGRRPMLEIAENRQRFERAWLLFGTRTEDELYFPDDLRVWSEQGIETHVVVENQEKTWTNGDKFVTGLVPQMNGTDPKRTVAYVVGPQPMFLPVVRKLKGIGMQPENIFLSFERRMRCSVGKCGHCRINHRLACKDGPVISMGEILKENLWEALALPSGTTWKDI